VIADITRGPASFQIRQDKSDPAAIPHSVNIMEFSEPSRTSYLVIVSPEYK